MSAYVSKLLDSYSRYLLVSVACVSGFLEGVLGRPGQIWASWAVRNTVNGTALVVPRCDGSKSGTGVPEGCSARD
jgi:hypothetical protein